MQSYNPAISGCTFFSLKRLHGKILPRLRGLSGLADQVTVNPTYEGYVTRPGVSYFHALKGP